MKRFLSTTCCAAVAVIAACGFAATSASALSLGPAGTKITGSGSVYGNSLGFRNIYFSGLEVSCRKATLSGTLNGSASVTAAHTFGECQAVSGATGAATVSAPGGLKLTLLTYTKRDDGTGDGQGQLSTGPGGLTVTVGTCTLSVGPNLDFAPPSAADGQMHMGTSKDGSTYAFLLNNAQSAYAKYPYTGSSGCPAAQRGAHASGAGLGFYNMKITGMTLAP